MFNFTTNVIINSADQIAMVKDAQGNADKIFRVKRYRDFKVDQDTEKVKSIYKAVGYAGALTKAEIDLSLISTAATENTLYRIITYVRLQGSNNPLWANDFVFKGKPFAIEFIVKKGETGTAAVATRAANAVAKMQKMLVDDPIFEVTTDGTKVVLTAVNKNERIYNIKLEKFEEDLEYTYGGSYDLVAQMDTLKSIDATDGTTQITEYFDVDGELTTTAGAGKIVVTQGIEDFGTFAHLQKDYRLPTQANTRWLKIDEDNYPVPGTVYTQYTIKIESDRGVTGQSVVGQPGSSITTHVFWVAPAAQTAFEAGLTAIGWTNGNSGDTNKNGVIDDDETKA